MSEIVRNRCASCNATFDKGETRYGSHDDTQLCKSCSRYKLSASLGEKVQQIMMDNITDFWNLPNGAYFKVVPDQPGWERVGEDKSCIFWKAEKGHIAYALGGEFPSLRYGPTEFGHIKVYQIEQPPMNDRGILQSCS